jgi:hypothetical protein
LNPGLLFEEGFSVLPIATQAVSRENRDPVFAKPLPVIFDS